MLPTAEDDGSRPGFTGHYRPAISVPTFIHSLPKTPVAVPTFPRKLKKKHTKTRNKQTHGQSQQEAALQRQGPYLPGATHVHSDRAASARSTPPCPGLVTTAAAIPAQPRKPRRTSGRPNPPKVSDPQLGTTAGAGGETSTRRRPRRQDFLGKHSLLPHAACLTSESGDREGKGGREQKWTSFDLQFVQGAGSKWSQTPPRFVHSSRDKSLLPRSRSRSCIDTRVLLRVYESCPSLSQRDRTSKQTAFRH